MPSKPDRRRISKAGVLRLLDEMDTEKCLHTASISPATLMARDYGHLLPEHAPQRAALEVAIDALGESDTGVGLFLTTERSIAIRPPVPIPADVSVEGVDTGPMRLLLHSEPLIGIVLLRLGRYAIAALKGDRLLATKTDSRYVKNRHRAGGSSQRRFERSRQRLIRELYDKTCETARTVFGPFLNDIDYVMLGGERHILNGFVERCRLMRDLQPKTLSRLLEVDAPNQRALNGISYEVWKSGVIHGAGVRESKSYAVRSIT